MSWRFIALLVLSTSTAAAQEPADPLDVKHRNDCRLAAQVLTHGQPANKRAWARNIIQSCPEADDVIPGLWSELPASDEEIEGLFHLSRQVRDGRIFEAAYLVAADPAHEPLLRIAALGVLGSYVVPDLHLHLPMEPLAGPEPLRYDNIWSRIDHSSQREGSIPLPADAEARVRSLVTDLADPETAEDHAPEVFAAAWWLAAYTGEVQMR